MKATEIRKAIAKIDHSISIQRKGVRCNINHDGGKTYSIWSLFSDKRGKGYASELFDIITAEALRNGYHLRLGAGAVTHIEGHIPQDKLIAFYKRKGFVFEPSSVWADFNKPTIGGTDVPEHTSV